MEFVRHQLSALFGNLNSQEMKELEESILEHGIQNPTIYVVEGEGDGTEDSPYQIVDGWHRYQALLSADATDLMDVRTIPIEDAVPTVIANNIYRRHLTPAQRAELVVRAYGWAKPGNPDQPTSTASDPLNQSQGEADEDDAPPPPPPPVKTNQEMAEAAQVSVNTIKRAKEKVRDEQEQEQGGPSLTVVKKTLPSAHSGISKNELSDRIVALEQELEATQGNLHNAESEAQHLRDAADGSISESQQYRELRNALNELQNAKVQLDEANRKVEMLRRREGQLVDLCSKHGIKVEFE